MRQNAKEYIFLDNIFKKLCILCKNDAENRGFELQNRGFDEKSAVFLKKV